MRSRSAVLLAAAPLVLLGACGGDEPKAPAPKAAPGPTCQTEGTVESQPASSLLDAVAPFREEGQELVIAEKVAGTAQIQLDGDGADVPDATVTLVHTGRGWVVTSITRC